MEIKVINTMFYLDGGTTTVFTDKGTWTIDGRIGSKTKDRLFTDYPDRGILIEDEELTDSVLKALENYKPIQQTF